MSNMAVKTLKDWDDYWLSTWMVVLVVAGRLNQNLILKNLERNG